MGNYEDALRFCDLVLEAIPSDDKTLVFSIEILEEMGEHTKAEEMFLRRKIYLIDRARNHSVPGTYPFSRS
jgi:tetratricopeptide (TPR) repeat protein